MKSVMQRIVGVVLKPWNWFKNKSFKKKLLIIVLLLIALIVFFSVIGNITQKPKYSLSKVEKGNITEIVTETGSITASGTVNVYSPTNGVVENVLISNGSSVQEGDELFTVKSSATEQEQKQAYANYMTAVSSLGSAQAGLHALQSAMFGAWDDYKTLAEGDGYENSDGTPKTDQRTLPEFHVAEKDWLAAEAQYKNQQSVVGQAQAQVSSTWLLYQATQNATVKAPADGTVSNLSVTNGSSVSINTPAVPSQPVLTLSSGGVTEIAVSLSESDVAKVKMGQNAEIDVSAIDDKTYKGVVKRVDTIGTENLGVVRYNAYIEVLNPDNNLRPGMTADVEITTNELKGVLTVPNSAVKPYQGGRAVRIVGKNGEAEFKPVKIGVRGVKNTQIISGVDEGTEIITALSNEQIQRPGLFGN